jgi:hypothetical protein
MTKIVAIAITFFLLVFVATTHAQTNPLPLGTVTPGATLGSCSNVTVLNHSMFGANMNCQDC